MGLWTAARLGLRLAKAEKRISSSIRRRSITTSGGRQSIEQIEHGFNKGKRIYLCFDETALSLHRKVVRSFQLHHRDSSDDEDYLYDVRPEELTFIASKRPQDTLNHSYELYGFNPWDPNLNPWVCFGDKILHYAGKQRISWIDTRNRLLKFEDFSRRKTKIKSFSNDKDDIMWGEIDGKLYCIDNDNNRRLRDKTRRRNLFEVLDPENNADWRPLDDPPYILQDPQDRYISAHRSVFLNGSKKILGWELNRPGTFCFDVTNPENGWKELPYDIRKHGGRPFVIHHQNHPVLRDDFNLFFSYYPYAENPLVIYPFYMSNNCESFQAINNSPIELPEFCYDYLPRCIERAPDHNDLPLMYQPHSSAIFEFVNLGAQKFGFILNKHRDFYPNPSNCPDNANSKLKGDTCGVLFLTYKYDIIVINKALEIRTRLIGCRHFRYRSIKRRSSNIFMLGAFAM